jgi:hypothetical protein
VQAIALPKIKKELVCLPLFFTNPKNLFFGNGTATIVQFNDCGELITC